MAKDKEESVFDIARIREFIDLMEEKEVSEIDLKHADQRIRLRRGADAPVVSYQQPAAASTAPSSAAPAEAAEDSNFIYIESPTIGTFYSKPKPEADNFVKVGDVVTPDTIVCLVEAMKMFNEIPAGVSGKIVECLVQNEEPVDNNKPLFKILPS